MRPVIMALIIVWAYTCIFGQTVTWQNPWPQGKTLLGVNMLGENSVIAIKSDCGVLQTDDGGITWDFDHTGNTSKRIYSMFFRDDLYGWAIGGSSVYRTEDGGLTWSANHVSRDDLTVNSVYFKDKNNGWCLASYFDEFAMNLYNFFWVSTDGGRSWDVKELMDNESIGAICFADKDTGWIFANKLLKTVNGGDTWEEEQDSLLQDGRTAFFKNANTGLIVGNNGLIAKTDDKGRSWKKINSNSNASFGSVYFDERGRGIIICGNTVLTSDDNGESWTILNTNSTEGICHVNFLDHEKGWAVGHSGLMLKTEDNGKNWSQISKGTKKMLLTVSFADVKHGWCAGKEGTIVYTDNGGDSWTVQESGIQTSIRSVLCTGRDKCIAVGDSGLILITVDSGATWNVYPKFSEHGLREIFCVKNSDTAYIAGENGTILKSVNGGLNWIQQDCGFTERLNSLYFVHGYTGWIVGESGLILKTINGGKTWVQLPSDNTNSLSQVCFIDARTGWATSNNNSFLFTYDGGTSWNFKQFSAGTRIDDFEFFDAQNGWVLCGYTLFSTSDGGTSWNADVTLPDQYYTKLELVNQKTGWAVGSGGTIIKVDIDSTSIEKGTTTDEIITNENIQIVNKNNTIQFQLLLKGNMKADFKLFTVMGKEIYALHGIEKDTRITIGTDRFSAGVYLYRFSSQHVIKTGMFQLLK